MIVYFSNSGGDSADDRFAGHQSVAGNAMVGAAVALQKQRQLAAARGEDVADVDPDDIAKYVKELEDKGLVIAEGGLCAWATKGQAPRFCKFIVNSNEVQWVNNVLINLPIVAQVTHQIATLAAGAIDYVQDAVKSAMQKVADAVNKAAGGLVKAATDAATNIVHSVLNFFGFADGIVSRFVAASVGMRFDVGTLAIENVVV